MKKPIVIAHRGASKAAPENTMSAFKKAVEMNAGGIELDVHLTRDGYLVVTHDDHLGRTCNGQGLVKEFDLDYLMSLDFGVWFSTDFKGEKIPLLSEVFELLSGKNMLLNIEIKATPGKYNEGIEHAVAEMIKAYDFTRNTIVSSFNHYSLIRMKKELPGVITAPLYAGLFAGMDEYARKIGAGAIHPNSNGVIADVADSCKKSGILVNVWTVDNEDDMRRFASLGVDGLITNVPDVALDTFSKL